MCLCPRWLQCVSHWEVFITLEVTEGGVFFGGTSAAFAAYASLRMHRFICTATYASLRMHRYICIATYASLHMHRYICVATYAWLHMHRYICIATYAWRHMRGYICIATYSPLWMQPMHRCVCCDDNGADTCSRMPAISLSGVVRSAKGTDSFAPPVPR